MKRIFRIIDSRSGITIATQALVADNMLTRFKGLLGRNELRSGEALIIRPCRMVHMFFMRFPIDVVFCTAEHMVVETQAVLKPWRLSMHVPSASYVIELPAGMCKKTNIRRGDVLIVERELGESRKS